MTTYSNIHEALQARTEAMGRSLNDYNWSAMLDELRAAALDPMTIDDDVFARFLQAHELERWPIGPCPSWCEHEAGHRWDSIDGDSNRQLRTHSRRLGQHVDLTVEEFTGEPLFSRPIGLWVSIDADAMTGAQVRALAAELLNAADELDKVTNGCDPWTEDEL
jgi:hypothetical protein